ncbi:MAG TPA: hypothetical protein VIK48_03805, partial [Candidatus Manganitrophaceae bacterium]
SMESTSSRMSKLAKEEIYFGRYFSLEEVIREINKVSLDQVQKLSQRLFDSKYLSLSALGNIEPKAFPQELTL